MSKPHAWDSIPLSDGWPTYVKSILLHVISLAHACITCARGRAANSRRAHVRLLGQMDKFRNDNELLKEEMRIKDARMASMDPHRRPYYSPTERFAILALRAARGWSTAQTAEHFMVQPATITSWTRRVDEDGKGALLQLQEPVNKFPEFVRHIVRR